MRFAETSERKYNVAPNYIAVLCSAIYTPRQEKNKQTNKKNTLNTKEKNHQ